MIDECTGIAEALKRQLSHLQALRQDREKVHRNFPSAVVSVSITIPGGGATYCFQHDLLDDAAKKIVPAAMEHIVRTQEEIVKASQERLTFAMEKLFEPEKPHNPPVTGDGFPYENKA